MVVLALKIVVPNSLRNPLWLCELQKGAIHMYVCMYVCKFMYVCNHVYAIGFLKYPTTMGDLPEAADLYSTSLPFDPNLLSLLNQGAGNLTAAAESHKALQKIGKQFLCVL